MQKKFQQLSIEVGIWFGTEEIKLPASQSARDDARNRRTRPGKILSTTEWV